MHGDDVIRCIRLIQLVEPSFTMGELTPNLKTVSSPQGCQNSLLGPAMSDLARLLNTTSENISVALSLKNFIFSISTILVSFSFKIFGNRQRKFVDLNISEHI